MAATVAQELWNSSLLGRYRRRLRPVVAAQKFLNILRVFKCMFLCVIRGRDDSVGIAIHYGMHDPGIESR